MEDLLKAHSTIKEKANSYNALNAIKHITSLDKDILEQAGGLILECSPPSGMVLR